VSKRDDPAALQELHQLRSDLEDVDLDLSSGELSDDPDFASRLLHECGHPETPGCLGKRGCGWCYFRDRK